MMAWLSVKETSADLHCSLVHDISHLLVVMLVAMVYRHRSS